MLTDTKQLNDPAELGRLMRLCRIGDRRLAKAVGRGKSTIERLRRGGQRSTGADVADAIEKELGVEPGTLFVVPALPPAPPICPTCGAGAVAA